MPNVKEIVISLSELLSVLTKDELHDIRRTLQVPRASQLNKNELVRSLSSYMIDHLEEHLERLDHNRYRMLKKVMDAPKSILAVDELIDDDDYEPFYYRQYGFLFLFDGAVIMPHEIREGLLQVDNKRLRPLLDRNTEWVRLTQGLLYYYGYLEISKLIERIEDYTGKTVKYLDYWKVIYDLDQYESGVGFSPAGLSYFLVDDPQRIELEHRSRPELEYYPFTKAQVLRAADYEYVDRHAGYRSFVSFLLSHWEMDKEEADLITEGLFDDIRRGDSLPELISSLQESLELTDAEQLQQLTQALVNLVNKTRLWELKGHAPEEVFEDARKQLKPLPQHPVQIPQSADNSLPQESSPSGNVYDFHTKKKVGRNDPCPCGSGKKFKKCCGASL